VATRNSWVEKYVAMANGLQKATAAEERKWKCRRMKDGYRIEAPDGGTTMLHMTYSDSAAEKLARGDLSNLGFFDDWIALEEKRNTEKVARLEAERKQAEVRAQQLSERSVATVRAAGGYMVEAEAPDFGWALSKDHPAPMCRYMLVTPALAAALLERNSRNRPIYKANVRTFKDFMEEGLWRFTHEAVALDQNGILQDGQHRLTSIVESGVPQGILIFVGMPPENFSVIGTGKTRNNADTLGLITEGNLGQKASVVRLVSMYRHIGARSPKGAKVSNGMCFEMWAADADRFIHAMRWGQRIGKRSAIQTSAAAAAAYLLFHDHGDENEFVAEFLYGLEYKVDERTGDPRGLLHRHMDNAKDRGQRLPHYAQLALIIKTWNMVVSDEVVDRRTHLRWAEDQKLPRILNLAAVSATPRFLVKPVSPSVTPTFQMAA
jgi:hypothetical protein